jgi:hypothetical protein
MEGSYNPLSDQSSAPPPSGTARGNAAQGNPQNPLTSLAGPLPGLPPRPPAPTAAQTTAAIKRFGAVQSAMRDLLQNPNLGRTNVRPAIMDQASKLLSARVLSLPEVMSAIGKVGDDPLAQKSLVAGIFTQAQQAENAVLAHHTAAVAMGMVQRGGEKYQAADHDRHMSSFLGHYPNPKA